MREFPGFVSIDFASERELLAEMYPNRYQGRRRRLFDARDRIVAVGRLLAASAGLMAVHALVQVAVTASQVLNMVPVLWGAGFLGWTWAALLLRRSAATVGEVQPC